MYHHIQRMNNLSSKTNYYNGYLKDSQELVNVKQNKSLEYNGSHRGVVEHEELVEKGHWATPFTQNL